MGPAKGPYGSYPFGPMPSTRIAEDTAPPAPAVETPGDQSAKSDTRRVRVARSSPGPWWPRGFPAGHTGRAPSSRSLLIPPGMHTEKKSLLPSSSSHWRGKRSLQQDREYKQETAGSLPPPDSQSHRSGPLGIGSDMRNDHPGGSAAHPGPSVGNVKPHSGMPAPTTPALEMFAPDSG